MPRLVQRPPFPDTPGRWLACYRYRWQPQGRACSPEQLGALLGVSGTTVRRWEGGQLRPTHDDVMRFARCCSISRLEEQFLIQSFQHREFALPPETGTFGDFAREALDVPNPALLMDNLFYIRGRNRFHYRLSGRELTPANNNALMGVFGPGRVPSQRRSSQRLLRSFWYIAAGLSDTPQYRSLLHRLREFEDFTEIWWGMALTTEGADTPLNLPMVYTHPDHGSFRVYVVPLVLPPVYYLREYVPIDEQAARFVERLRRDGTNDVELTGPAHWTLQD